MHAKAWEYGIYAVRFHSTAGNFDAAISMLDALAHDDVHEHYYVRKELLFSMIMQNHAPRDVLVTQGNKVLDAMCMLDDHHESQQFFMELEIADADLYRILMQEKK